ncbi:hypothetical protein C8R43DRAFT_966232 [Mycena crocata]|nr:hypothetical protein C8R43DRAFT_966232 [Mycena crocata]
MGSRGYVRLLVYMSGADRQSMERRRAPSWPCEGWTDWGDASTDGMEGAKLAMRGMDGLGRRVDGWDGGRQVGHARYEGTQGWRTLDGYLFDSTRTTMFEETLPTYPSSDEHSRATHIHKILHITFLLGVAVLQDPGCGRVAQIARIPAISLCWAFSSFRCQRHFRPAFPPGKFRLRGNAWSRRNRYRGLMRDGLEIELLHKLDFERVIILNMCIASGSAYALAVQAPGFERTDRSSIVATSPSSKTPLLQQQNRPWPGHTSYALSNLLIMIMHTRAAFFLDFHHPSHYKNPPHRLLLGVTVRQDPGCGRVAQMARIPVISLCWAFSSFSASRRENTFALLRTILLGVPVPQGASATSDPHFPQESLGYVGMARIC